MSANSRLKKKAFLFLLGAAVLSLVLSSCGSGSHSAGEEDQVKYLIGMSQANLSEPWRVVMNEEIKEEALKYRDVRIIFTDAAQDSLKQIRDIENLLGQGIDLLMVSPNDEKLLAPVIARANRQIPVIVLDRELEGGNYTLYIGADNKKIGTEAGELVYQLLGDKGGNVIEVQGLEGSPPVIQRSEGFRESISRHPNIKIVDTIVANWMRDRTEDILKELYTRYPNVDVIFAHNDAMALGAHIAAQKMRVKNIKFIGVDGLPGPSGGIELVKTGILEGTFTNTFGGKDALQYAIRILNKEKDLPKKVTLKSRILTRQTLNP